MRSRKHPGRARGGSFVHAFRPPEARPLLQGVDNGPAVRLDPGHFAPPQRERGWGAYAESFIRANEYGLTRLDCPAEVGAGPEGLVVPF